VAEERIVLSRVIGRSRDGSVVAVVVAPLDRHDTDRENWNAYCGVIPREQGTDRRADDPLTEGYEWVADHGDKLPEEAARAILGYHRGRYRG
jgi:hypothetical protein